MPRANRYFVPGYLYHITHRCHNKSFLFKFKIDFEQMLSWIKEAKKRYDVKVYDYVLTHNHIHLILFDPSERKAISRFMQLAAGQFAEEYNARRKRHGAFWGDRYHSTAVDSQTYLLQCLGYIGLNMVRAGVVPHPEEWPYCGYHELISSRKTQIIDKKELAATVGLRSVKELSETYLGVISDKLQRRELERDSRWSESIAIGSSDFVLKFAEGLGVRMKNRKISGTDKVFTIRDERAQYGLTSKDQMSALEGDNTINWMDGID
jgi:putative transposase